MIPCNLTQAQSEVRQHYYRGWGKKFLTQTPTDIVILGRLLDLLDNNPVIVEVGVFGGYSLLSMANVCYVGSHFFGIDIKLLPNVEIIVRQYNLASCITLLECSSIEASNKFERVNMAHIDGDHTYEGCKSDLQVWYPKIISGGILTCHDYYNRGHPGVRQAVDEYLKDKGFIELRFGIAGKYSQYSVMKLS